MKLTPRVKKFMVLFLVIGVVTTLAGCTVPRDADGSIKLITSTTTFGDIMKDENWFSAVFVLPMAQLINYFSPKITVGGAIILITVLINGILAILTMKSTISSQQMQMAQPEIQKIQRKYEGRDDESSKMRQAAEIQAVYKKYDINPASMLVMFLQFPIIMAMYMAVQRSEAVQTGTFLGMDLQTSPLNGIKAAFSGDAASWMFIVLFALMVLCQFLSMKVPTWLLKSRAKKEAEKHHRRPEDVSNPQSTVMTVYMVGMIAVFGLTLPAAMSLYWAINSLVNVVKTIAVQKVIDQRKAKKEGSAR